MVSVDTPFCFSLFRKTIVPIGFVFGKALSLEGERATPRTQSSTTVRISLKCALKPKTYNLKPETYTPPLLQPQAEKG